MSGQPRALIFLARFSHHTSLSALNDGGGVEWRVGKTIINDDGRFANPTSSYLTDGGGGDNELW